MLPTFTLELTQMSVNMPFIEHLGIPLDTANILSALLHDFRKSSHTVGAKTNQDSFIEVCPVPST